MRTLCHPLHSGSLFPLFQLPLPPRCAPPPCLLCLPLSLLVWLPRSVCLCCSSPCLVALPTHRAVLGGGLGSGTPKFVYQKWPDQIFPIVNVVFSHDSPCSLGGGGQGGTPPPSSCGVQPFQYFPDPPPCTRANGPWATAQRGLYAVQTPPPFATPDASRRGTEGGGGGGLA